jgi:hypothetical protein
MHTPANGLDRERRLTRLVPPKHRPLRRRMIHGARILHPQLAWDGVLVQVFRSFRQQLERTMLWFDRLCFRRPAPYFTVTTAAGEWTTHPSASVALAVNT